ncbi:tyrosine-type recombinase/integrase [Chloroflexota bacterium]
MVTAVAIDLDCVARDYILNCEVEGKSPRTIATYGMVIRNFIWFCRKNDLYEPSEIKAPHIRKFMLYLTSESNRWGSTSPATRKPASKTTANDYFRALRCFFNWVTREGLIPENPMDNIKTPKAENKIIEPLSPNEITSLLNQCSKKTALDLRNRAIISVFIDSGLRISELVGLTLDDIDLDTGSITIRNGKGGKQRMVRIGITALQALRKYVLYYRKSESNRVFMNRNGEPLEMRGLKMVIKRLGEKTKVNVHPHKMRHTFGISYLRSGGDVFSLQYLLGHTSLSMTLRYLQSLNATDAAQAHRLHSPMDNLTKGRWLR